MNEEALRPCTEGMLEKGKVCPCQRDGSAFLAERILSAKRGKSG